MSKVIEPLYEDFKLSNNLDTGEYKNVLLIFWHGLGDLIMFLNPYNKLQMLYPDIKFTLAVQRGLSFEDIVPFAELIDGEYMGHLEEKPYDLIAKIHFPMNEGQQVYTKGEWCCIHELGIEPVDGHGIMPSYPKKLIGVHFNITCLPDSCNPDENTAKQIWQDIIDMGFIPIETHFQHVFHNPVNKKFDFIDCTVRKSHAKISNLIGLFGSLAGFVGVVSGNFHTALSVLSPEKIFFLEKHFKLGSFTKFPLAKASILPGEYKGEVKNWLLTLKEN